MSNFETNLTKAFGSSLLNNSVDPSMDFTKVSLDALIENSTLVEGTPVIKALRSVGKFVMPVTDKLFCKRVAVFLQAFNRAGLPQFKKDKHIDNLDQDKNLDSEYEQVLIYLEQCSNLLQVQYLGRFYAAYWNGDFKWERFLELAEANRRMFTGDYSVLQSAAGGDKAAFALGDKEAAVIRLASLGLIFDMRQKDAGISLTEFGIDFSTYLELAKTEVVIETKRFDEPDDLSEEEDPFEGLILDKPVFGKLKTEDEEKPAVKSEPVIAEGKTAEKTSAASAEAPVGKPEVVIAEEPVKKSSAAITEEPVKKPEAAIAEEIKAEKPLFTSGAAAFTSAGFAAKTEAEAPKEKTEPAVFKKPEEKKPEVEQPVAPAVFKKLEEKNPEVEQPVAPAASSPFKPIKNEETKAEAPGAQAPQAVPEYSPFKPASENRLAMARPEADQPKPQRAADPMMFHLTASTKQEVDMSDSKSGSKPYKPMGLGDPDGDSHQGTAKLGSYLSMDDDGDGDTFSEQTKLGSFSSLGGDDSGEKLPQRTESPSHFFPMNPAGSNGSALQGGSDSRPSPFKKAEPANPEQEAPKAPQAPSVSSPFKPLGSNDSNGASSGPKSPFKPLDT